PMIPQANPSLYLARPAGEVHGLRRGRRGKSPQEPVTFSRRISLPDGSLRLIRRFPKIRSKLPYAARTGQPQTHRRSDDGEPIVRSHAGRIEGAEPADR